MIDLELKLLNQCERCELSKTRTQVVIPRGDITARVMFIGEAPGASEDKRGIPFVGSAGKIFNSFLKEKLGLDEDQVYITNMVKCRPTTVEGKNRVPTDLEIKICGAWLVEEIRKLQPKVVVIMGGSALRGFFNGCKISQVAGEELFGHSISSVYGTRVFVIYHPAVLIYDKNGYEETYFSHLEKLKQILKEEGIIV